MYTLAEASLALLFGLSYMRFGLTPELGVFLLTLLVLTFIVFYDLRHTLVLPESSGLLIVLALVFRIMQGGVVAALITSAGIALFFFLLYALSRGRAMGLGDTPVSFGLALLAGHAAIPGFLFSFWIGGVIGILILVLRRGGPRMGIEVPFVPFMAAGFLLAIFTQWNPLPF
jgi:prepilin signal peptidase PulO-like enzyme (type II secretory pathway)